MKKRDLEKLQQEHGYPAVSIIVPTHRTIPEKLQDRIRIKNLMKEARERLAKEFANRDITPLLNHLDKLETLIDYTDTLDGLALFASAETAELFRLPFSVEERVTIDDNFETRDLIFTLNRTPRYWVLTLGDKFTRLLNGYGDTLVEMIGPTTDEFGQPASGFPLDFIEPNDTVRVAYAMGDRDSQYLDEHKEQYYRFVDDFFYENYLKDEPLPVFLAGTEEDIALFKKVTKHPQAYLGVKPGNFEHPQFTPGNLAQEIWPVAQQYLAYERKEVLKELDEAMNKGHYAFSFDPVWRMATEGRIHKLLVERDFRKAGVVDKNVPTNAIIYNDPQAPGISDDLVDNLIEMVISKGGGRVIFYEPGELAEHDHIAAILRY